MKYLIFVIIFLSCKSKIDCNKNVDPTNKIGLMVHGTFGFKQAYIRIVKINDPKDWDCNEYFTGKGFSFNKEDAAEFKEQDSCRLKNLYFRYLDSKENVQTRYYSAIQR